MLISILIRIDDENQHDRWYYLKMKEYNYIFMSLLLQANVFALFNIFTGPSEKVNKT
jgi:hypothetical protein